MKTILYVSQSTMIGADAGAQVRAIVDLARVRNARRGVTGALIYTGSRFAQILEGPAASVDDILSAVARDPRHDRVTLLPVRSPPRRRFDQWAMAYAGESSYVDRHLRALFQDIGELELNERSEALVELMWALNNLPTAA